MQGTITGNDFTEDRAWTVDVELHPGYEIPDKGHRAICFKTTGEMIPQYQIHFSDVEELGGMRIRLTFEHYDSHQYQPEFENAMTAGNYIALEVRE